MVPTQHWAPRRVPSGIGKNDLLKRILRVMTQTAAGQSNYSDDFGDVIRARTFADK